MRFFFSKKVHILVSLFLVSSAWGLWRISSRSQKPVEEIIFATATKGGTYYPLGSQLGRIIEELPNRAVSRVKVIETNGSKDNISHLLTGYADVALVAVPALVEHEKDNSDKREQDFKQLRVLARLYRDFVQVLVRKDKVEKADLTAGLEALRGLKVYIGGDGSATKLIAQKLLEESGPKKPDGTIDIEKPDLEIKNYESAATAIVNGEIDAAFLIAGRPTAAVKAAMMNSKEVTLLSLPAKDIADKYSYFDSDHIPAKFYPNQPTRIESVTSQTLLVSRTDTSKEVVMTIEEALFSNVHRLIKAHARAQEVKFDSAFKGFNVEGDGCPDGREIPCLHTAALTYWKRENAKLVILTGNPGGRYHFLGRRMKKLLDLNGIEARVEITDGSLENLKKLKERSNQLKQERETRGVGAVMAILQSDIANAASWEQEEAKYEKHFSENHRLRGLRRIASLHEENLHIFARRTWLRENGRSEFLDLNVRDLDELWETARVSVGPENSGSRLTAEALLDHLDVPTENRFRLSLADMVERMLEGELDIGFFISSVPSTVIGSILDSDAVVMLGLDPPSRSAIRGPGFEVSKIGKTEYASQAGSKHDVESIKTRAVLVMLENTPAKVFEITRAVVEGAKYLKLSDEEMVEELESVSLHEEAKRYYQEANLLPRRGMLFRELLSYIINGTWKFLAIVVIILGGFKGAIEVKRQNVKRALLQRVQNAFKLPHPHSLEVLAEIREDAFRRVPLPWWALSELDWGRWATVRDVIDEYKE